MRRKHLFVCAPLALAIVVVVTWYCLRGTPATRQDKEAERKEADAREKLAFESLEHRIPTGKALRSPQPLSEAAAARWEDLERGVDSQQARRAELLQALHERTRKFFVESPGFGPSRSMRASDEEILLSTWAETATPVQPGLPPDFPLSPGEAVTPVDPDADHFWYHSGSVLDFLYPAGFGYIKNRNNVAGFQPHGFRYLSVNTYPGKRWKVHHILLVGILMNERPVVYLSDKLPSMEQARTGTTRELDFFEEAGLASLKSGDDLHIAQKGDTLRMLGALRATRQCVKCHDAARGDLLGAFSYVLRPATTERSP